MRISVYCTQLSSCFVENYLLCFVELLFFPFAIFRTIPDLLSIFFRHETWRNSPLVQVSLQFFQSLTILIIIVSHYLSCNTRETFLIAILIVIGDRFKFHCRDNHFHRILIPLRFWYSNSIAEIEIENWFRSNQLNRQTNMMADFCYTNPTIVPGELLSRRGFSMYSGADNFDEDFGKNKSVHCGTYHEARSKFWSKIRIWGRSRIVSTVYPGQSINRLNRD